MSRVLRAWIALALLIGMIWYLHTEEVYLSVTDTYGIILCKNNCWHEAAHAADRVSHSEEFQTALNDYIIDTWITLRRDGMDSHTDLETFLANFPGVVSKHVTSDLWLYKHDWGGYTEAYACIIEYCEIDSSCIPAQLQEFYDLDLINHLYGQVQYRRHYVETLYE